MLSPDVQESARRSVLCWLATVNEAGQPSVSPKEIFTVFDVNHLVIANIASPSSMRNIGVNPLVCVSFVDIFVQKGFKVIGRARNVRRQDPEFAFWSASLEVKAGTRFPIHSMFVIEATAVESIVAPSYRLYPAETTEASQVTAALNTYGVSKGKSDA